ncbi:MAG: flagellar basal body rod protein FlgC [Candidatus Kapaibacteriota bacterium]
MKVGIFEIFKIASQGLNFQRKKLSAIAKNIANANTTRTNAGTPYNREIVVARLVENSGFQDMFENVLNLVKSDEKHFQGLKTTAQEESYLQAEVFKDNSQRLVYDPSHPDADENGYVRYPNINVVTEMVEMISAQRAFEANVSVIEASKNLARDSLEI